MRTQLFVVVCLVTAACGTDVRSDEPGDETPASGQSLFLDQCARCHGDDGKGTADAPTILSPVVGYATYVVRNGRGAEMGYPTGMDPFDTASLTDVELTSVLEWLGSAPKPTTGADLYGRYCINCHGANGRSGRVKINIVREVLELSQKVRYGHGGANYASRTSYMPAWGADALTDADLTALRTYVSGL